MQQRLAGQVDSADGIREAALAAFYEYGYHGTSVRELAKRANLSIAALYHHFPSKQQVLVELAHRHMDELLSELERAMSEGPGDPPEQLVAVVHAHVKFQTRRQRQGFVANSEIRSLNPEDRKAIVAKRNREQRVFDKVILRGVNEGFFDVGHPIEASRALVTMSTAVLSWYQEGDGLTPDDIADIYAELALGMVEFSGGRA